MIRLDTGNWFINLHTVGGRQDVSVSDPAVLRCRSLQTTCKSISTVISPVVELARYFGNDMVSAERVGGSVGRSISRSSLVV